MPASSRLQQPRSRPALRLWHRQPKGRSAESSSTPQAQRTADTAPPQADLKRPSSASTVPAVIAAGTQGEAKNNGPSAPKAKRPRADRSEDLPAAAGSAKQTPMQGTLARIPEKPVERPPEKPQASATLDLASLEQRLRDTRAIGVFAHGQRLTSCSNVVICLTGVRGRASSLAVLPINIRP